MRVVYELTINAVCPADGKPNVYQLTVRSARVIPVEDILAAVKRETADAAYQEVITERLFRALGAEVETFGIHSSIKVRCICGVAQ